MQQDIQFDVLFSAQQRIQRKSVRDQRRHEKRRAITQRKMVGEREIEKMRSSSPCIYLCKARDL